MANASVLETNVTLEQIASVLNLNITNSTDRRGVTPEKIFDLYEVYRSREREQLMVYKSVAYVLGTLIILSNLTVVISSGLILKKGQQPKSTYLLLGNVSLADTIIGISIIFGTVVDNAVSSNVLCIFQIGMIVCPTMVSIFSVGLIAIDRYIYIIHGLYYQRWINTTRVRIGILIIWMLGVCLGFMPATGWINDELTFSRCTYIGLFPGKLVLINSILSIVPIVVVGILYSIILVRAINNAKKKKATEIPTVSQATVNKLRMYRGNNKAINKNNITNFASNMGDGLRRSSSLSALATYNARRHNEILNAKSLSIGQLDTNKSIGTNSVTLSDHSLSSGLHSRSTLSSCSRVAHFVSKRLKSKKPHRSISKGVAVVMLSSGSFVFTWLPFFIVVVFLVLCEDKLTNARCMNLHHLVSGPMATLSFFNSVLNPLIYAWWHKGFKKEIFTLLRKCVWFKFCRIGLGAR